jgi:hypothetical protein
MLGAEFVIVLPLNTRPTTAYQFTTRAPPNTPPITPPPNHPTIHTNNRQQRSLEELDYVFAVPTRTHMKYQISQVAPYWFNKNILRKKGLKEPKLYKFDSDDAYENGGQNGAGGYSGGSEEEEVKTV